MYLAGCQRMIYHMRTRRMAVGRLRRAEKPSEAALWSVRPLSLGAPTVAREGDAFADRMELAR